MSVEILTFGCRLNAYESEVMRGHAAALSDTVIVNTCAVTAEAERQARQAIRRAARERPGARIVVTGCAAQIDPAAWAALPGVASRAGQRGQAEAGELGAGRTGRGVRHHGGARDGGASGDRVRRPGARVRAGAAGLRPSLHVLHHPVRPRPQPQRAGRRGGGAGARAGRGWLSGGGADRGRYRLVRAAICLARHGWGSWCGGCWRWCRSCGGCACHRSIRRRSTTISGGCSATRTAADAASAPVATGRQRPDPEAHEAPASAGRRRGGDRARAGRCGQASLSAPI